VGAGPRSGQMKWEAPVALAGPAQGLPDTKVGAFTQALYDEAKDKGWTVISMKDDWNRIFAFEASGSRALQQGESTVQHVTRRRALMCRLQLWRLRSTIGWLWVHCERCQHRSAAALVPLMIRWGADASSDLPRRSARCTRCGWGGLQAPVRGWPGSVPSGRFTGANKVLPDGNLNL
jgi:hypothetical protein